MQAARSAHGVDLADRASVEGFCEAAQETAYFGLVHNAGQPYDALAAMMMQDKAEAVHAGEFLVAHPHRQDALRGMIRARAGRIVAIGSVARSRAIPATPPMRRRRARSSPIAAPSRSRRRSAASPSTRWRRGSSTPT